MTVSVKPVRMALLQLILFSTTVLNRQGNEDIYNYPVHVREKLLGNKLCTYFYRQSRCYETWMIVAR